MAKHYPMKLHHDGWNRKCRVDFDPEIERMANDGVPLCEIACRIGLAESTVRESLIRTFGTVSVVSTERMPERIGQDSVFAWLESHFDCQDYVPRPAERPTRAWPGTAQKLAVLRRRAELGEDLWHPADAKNCDRMPDMEVF